MSSAVIPSLLYRDAKRAIAWLEEAFGFAPLLVVEGEGDAIAHAQLVLGSGMLMLGSERAEGIGEYVTTVGEGEPPTGGIYVVVEDVEAHAARAKAAGAEIVMPPEDQPYGGRNYTCRDLEGNIWSFGSYDPWAAVSG